MHTTMPSAHRCQNVGRILRLIAPSGFAKTLISAVGLVAYSASFAPTLGAQDPFLPSAVHMVSTVPSNGDVNPYGVAFIGKNFLTGSGPLRENYLKRASNACLPIRPDAGTRGRRASGCAARSRSRRTCSAGTTTILAFAIPARAIAGLGPSGFVPVFDLEVL